MKAFVVYESLYGNTRKVAEAIVAGLQTSIDAEAALVADARPAMVDGAALVVVGAPTHAWSLSRRRTRQVAADDVAKRDGCVERAAVEIGVRDWLRDIHGNGHRSAAFDTRLDRPRILTGSAMRAIERGLLAAEFSIFSRPRSFRVTSSPGPLAEGELDRARQWGEEMGRAVVVAEGLHKAA
jgi:hypothetical protein